MEMAIRNNRVYLYQSSLGPAFVDLSGNATVDRFGRVRVYVAPETRVPSFYTTVDRLPTDLVRAMLERLDVAQAQPPLAKLATTSRASLLRKERSTS